MKIRINVHFYNLITNLVPARYGWMARRLLARACGVRVKGKASLNVGVYFSYSNVHIGEAAWIGPFVKFYSTPDASIIIGRNCDIAPEVLFVTGTHEIATSCRRAGLGLSHEICIGDGCWIGARAQIMGGVKLGEGTIVGAGALVLPGRYPEGVMLVGVPAVIKRRL